MPASSRRGRRASRGFAAVAALSLAAGCGRAVDAPLRAYGTVEAREVRIASRVAGRVRVVHVDEDDRVDAGKPVVELDLSELESARAEALAVLRAAEARERLLVEGSHPEDVAATRSALTAARARAAAAQRELERVRALREGDAVASRSLEDARTALDLAHAEVAGLEAQLRKMVAGARREEVAAAAAARSQAEAALAGIDDRLEDRVLSAPSAGTVLHRLAEPGEVARPGVPLLVLGDLAHPHVDVYVPERRVGEVAAGGQAEVRVDAWPGRTFVGTVRRIASEAEFTPKNVQTDDQRARLVFRVRVDVADPEGVLRPGMPAEVSFPRSAPAGTRPARTEAAASRGRP